MATRYFCDRCDDEMTQSAYVSQSDLGKPGAAGDVQFGYRLTQTKPASELCPRCLEVFNRWLQTPDPGCANG